MRPITPEKKPRPVAQGQSSLGFPSPAEDYEEPPLDLHELVVANPPATYFMRADTNCMEKLGIELGDILVVDRSLAPKNGCFVIAVIEDSFHVKMCHMNDGVARLIDDHKAMEAAPDVIWGVVTYITRKV